MWNNEAFVELIEAHRITCTSAATPFLPDTLSAPVLGGIFLRDKGVARQFWPECLELMAALPATASGKTSGARLALTAAMELHGRGARRATATMCIGVGQGMSVLLGSA